MNTQFKQIIQEQVRKELDACTIYAQLAYYAKSQGWDNLADFMGEHSTEELKHARKFAFLLGEHSIEAKVKNITTTWNLELTDYTSVVVAALDHEKYITGEINSIVKLTETFEVDETSTELLKYFVNEQKEEEWLFEELLRRIESSSEETVEAALSHDALEADYKNTL